MTKVVLVSRCAWTLFNFRQGQMRALRGRGDEVVGGGAGGDGYEPRIRDLGVRFEPLPIGLRALDPLGDIRLFWRMVRWYRAERPDVVHHFTIKPVIYGSLAARLAGVPRVINSVEGLGTVFASERIGWLRRAVEFQYRLALRAATFTFFLNRDDRDLFVNRGLVAPQKAGLIPGCGVDTAHFAPRPPEDEAKPPGVVRFLMLARLLRDKGVYEYAEAARIVRAEHPNAEFVLLGGRDERNPTVVPQADLEKWQAEGVLCWLGETDDVRPVIAGADVIVLPSYYREGVPRSLLEAAAMGKPLITTQNVGCREAVDDGVNGLLVPVRDANALAGAMKNLLRDPEMRERMGRAGREKAVREFEEKVVLDRVIAAYDAD